MAINFPTPTSVGQTFTNGSGITWEWTGSSWKAFGQNASNLPTRQTVNFGGIVATQTGNEYYDVDINASTYTIHSVTTNSNLWVRIYIDNQSRTNDASRQINVDPAPGIGLVCEVIKDNALQVVTPGAVGYNNGYLKRFYVTVATLETSPHTASIDVVYQPLEPV